MKVDPADPEEVLAVETDLEAAVAVVAILAHVKCIKQCAPIAVKNAKYHSNQALMHQAMLDQYTVETVIRTTRNTKTRHS